MDIKKVPSPDELEPEMKMLMGSVKLPKDFDYKKELKRALSRKYRK